MKVEDSLLFMQCAGAEGWRARADGSLELPGEGAKDGLP